MISTAGKADAVSLQAMQSEMDDYASTASELRTISSSLSSSLSYPPKVIEDVKSQVGFRLHGLQACRRLAAPSLLRRVGVGDELLHTCTARALNSYYIAACMYKIVRARLHHHNCDYVWTLSGDVSNPAYLSMPSHSLVGRCEICMCGVCKAWVTSGGKPLI